jgi:hypothetical protein
MPLRKLAEKDDHGKKDSLSLFQISFKRIKNQYLQA